MHNTIKQNESMRELLQEFIVDAFVLLPMFVIGFFAEHNIDGIISFAVGDFTLLNIQAANSDMGVSIINIILPYLKAASLMAGLIYTSYKVYKMYKEGESKTKG